MASSSSLPPGYEKDEKFWFHDGSIVLLARDTAFKVHQGVLSRHSVVFRDLFAVPQPADAEMLDGCPVLHMQDDPDQLHYLLRVLYDSRRYYMSGKGCFHFEELESFIRLGNKYQIADLFEDALGNLKSVCTKRYEVWEEYASLMCNSIEPICLGGTDVIAAVNIARMTGEETMLPVALYLCCQLTGAQLLAGRELPGGIVERLSEGDLARCINGKAVLAHRDMLAWARVHTAMSAVCTNDGTCALRAQERLQEPVWQPDTDVLEKVHTLQFVALHHQGEICEECAAQMVSTHESHLRETWDNLPSYFGLGTWADLKEPERPPRWRLLLEE